MKNKSSNFVLRYLEKRDKYERRAVRMALVCALTLTNYPQ